MSSTGGRPRVLRAGKEYAVLLRDYYPRRPLLGKWNGKCWTIYHPTVDVATTHPQIDVEPLSEWDGRLPKGSMTWRQYGALLAGQVLQQNEIASRLRKLGLNVRNEPYVSTDYNPLDYLISLTYDQWNALLDRIPTK